MMVFSAAPSTTERDEREREGEGGSLDSADLFSTDSWQKLDKTYLEYAVCI